MFIITRISTVIGMSLNKHRVPCMKISKILKQISSCCRSRPDTLTLDAPLLLNTASIMAVALRDQE